ncbi:hypothetical protein QBC35DRAFT_393892 [Podospora australis]|uniref:Secreted protein n=1 Tax=Podospora australis TaxID=1536484 RepID=A0AAN6WL86_9PEZI|nr:hypothetical protein QBC35DRAFT_393892 [Podospora australis]
MHFFQVLPLFAGLAASLATPVHLEQRQAGPQNVQIAEIAFTGTGCPARTIAAQTVSNATTIDVPQVVFKAESGLNGTRVVETRQNCQIIIRVNHAAGWQFSVVKADYYGRVALAQGAEATSRTTYSFSGMLTHGVQKQRSSQYYFDGPFNGLYFRNDRYVGTARQWSPCGSGSSLNITSEVRVAPIGAGVNRPASMEIFNLLGGKLGLNWQTCR